MDTNRENWNTFILAHGGSFLQSWEWGEFQERAGKRVFRFFSPCHSERSEESIDWAAQFIENKLPGVNKFYWYAPRGPVIANSKEQMANSQSQEFTEEVKNTAGENVIFFRLGPERPLDCHPDPAVAGEGSKKDSSASGLRMTDPLYEIGFRRLPYDIEPAQTLILDITKSEDELLAQMHEKWRYNIRLAERKGVKVKIISAEDSAFERYFEEFYRLVSGGTSERKGLKHHLKDYYRKQLETSKQLTDNSQRPRFLLFVAEYENKVVAANIVVIFGNRATYLHGATSSEYREAMAPHLLQWEQIKYAKSQGCAEYDFWGIVNEHTLDKRGQSWEGFTRFKKGFGGREVNYVGYFDYPLNRLWYGVYRLVQKFRR